ncbi:hypothetical protein JDV02_008429 [Purpureocillium takamizusanense]|uniref:Uncharacterized protein n=1 Tax=Purpureocillium takamizusanense TaxID=2060973 RepID=A0A9Q8VDA8_9HYPO|nr:uncharacterized protein JDV02_008429 [Purpureocillium takamizusanense]UNI22550.1 hypothetical protein JDV02_008429 [Purpureocillium takamizusanense]
MRLPTAGRLAASVLAVGALLVAVASAADGDVSWDKNKVLGIQGGLVPAGEPVMIYTNVSNSKYAKGGFEKMEVYLDVQGKQNATTFFPDVYCVIAPCVWTNVTAFNVTIPKDAFPSGAEMKIWSEIYGSHQPGKDPGGFVHPDEGVRFNLTSGNGSFSDYEKRNGWSIFGGGAYLFPCDVITCARMCMVMYLDPNKSGLTQSYTRTMKSCVEACGSYVESDLERRSDCITTNATDHKETGSKGGSDSGSGHGSDGKSKDGGESSAPGPVAVTDQAGRMLMVAWSLAWLVIWSF